jgi:hypothetical protein
VKRGMARTAPGPLAVPPGVADGSAGEAGVSVSAAGGGPTGASVGVGPPGPVEGVGRRPTADG